MTRRARCRRTPPQLDCGNTGNTDGNTGTTDEVNRGWIADVAGEIVLSARFAPHAALRIRPGLHHPPGPRETQPPNSISPGTSATC